MLKHSKALAVAVAAIAAMAIGASTASAVTVSPGGAFTATSVGRLNFTSSLATIACNVGLTGSLNRTGSVGSSAGSVSGVSVSSCTTGYSVQILNTPWNLRLTGATNDDADLLLEGASFQVSLLGAPVCLVSGNIPFNYAEGGNIVIGTNTLSGSCGSASLRAGSEFTLSPAQDITV